MVRFESTDSVATKGPSMFRFLNLLPVIATTAFCAAPDSLADSAQAAPPPVAMSPVPAHAAIVPMDSPAPEAAVSNSLRPGSWGIGLRPFGTTTSLLGYRVLSPRWETALRLSWSDVHTNQQTPSTSTTSTYQYQYVDSAPAANNNRTSSTSASGTASSVSNTRTLTAVWLAEYDLPTGHGVDFKAGVGPAFSWTWNDASQSSDFVDQNGTPLPPVLGTSGSWTATGGLRGTLGVRWWFVPQRLALAGEFEGGGNVGYTSAHSNATTSSIQILSSSTAPNYNYMYSTTGQTSSRSNTWTLSTTSYNCSVGVDAFF